MLPAYKYKFIFANGDQFQLSYLVWIEHIATVVDQPVGVGHNTTETLSLQSTIYLVVQKEEGQVLQYCIRSYYSLLWQCTT